MAEYFDIYDDRLNKIGVKLRDHVHRDGDWHRVFHCWVIYRDDDGVEWIILQKRSPDKKIYANYLDVSAAGHYTTGETIRDGVREVQEELGLEVTFEDLIPAGRRVTMNSFAGLIDREVADVFFYICSRSLSQYSYQREEIAGIIALNIDDALQLYEHNKSELCAPAVGLGKSQVTVALTDFVPTVDHYFHKILILAKRCLNGERPLLI